MSQKRLKRIKKAVAVGVAAKPMESFLGIRGIVKENWKFLMLLCVGIFLVYFNGLNAGFVSDDYAGITQNPTITNLSVAIKSGLPTLASSLIAVLFGTSSPLPYHLFSLVLYITVCLLAFIFIYLLYSRKLAMFTLLLFAFHPIHVEAVTWISGRPYLITTIIVLTALIGILMYLNNKKRVYIFGVGLSLVLMFFADIIRGFSFFLILGLIAFVFKDKYVFLNNGKKYLKFLIIPIIIIGIFAYPMAMTRIDGVNSGYNASDSIFYDPRFQYPTAITKYLQLLLVPIDLTLYHTMYTFPVWLNWIIFVLYLVSLVYFVFKNKAVFFALAFIFVATAPSMLPVKVSWLTAERYMFFGSLGFCLLIGIVLSNISRKKKLVVTGLLGILVAGGSARIILRNIDWQTNHNLWVVTCQMSPNSHNAWNNIGDDYDKLGQPENAIKGFSQSVLVKPNYADAYHNRANIFFKTGRLDLARASYDTALSFSPSLAQTYFSLTQIDLMEKRFDLALEHSQKALQLQQNNPQAWYVVGVVLTNSGNIEKAKEAFKNVLILAPDFVQAKQALTQLSAGKS